MRYLKEAFWAQISVPYLGAIPFNVLALTLFGIFGFVESAVWPLGGGLEVAYLFLLCSNPRFQRVINARAQPNQEKISDEDQEATLIERLNLIQRRKLNALKQKCQRILNIYAEQQADEFMVSSNSDALKKFQWLYLKLLVAQHYLEDSQAQVDSPTLSGRIDLLQNELKLTSLSSRLRESKEATLRLLQQRVAALQKRTESLAEIDSDLSRVETQVDLALDNASMQGQSEIISANIDLTSHLFVNASFGDLAETVQALEQTFTSPSNPQKNS